MTDKRPYLFCVTAKVRPSVKIEEAYIVALTPAGAIAYFIEMNAGEEGPDYETFDADCICSLQDILIGCDELEGVQSDRLRVLEETL